MKGRIAFASLIGGFIAWIYFSISWFFLPNSCDLAKKFKNDDAVRATLIENAYSDGIYVLPNLCEKTNLDNKLFLFGALKLDGVDTTSPARYLYSLLIQVVGAFFIAIFMNFIKDLIYWKRLISGFLIAIIASVIAIFIPDGVWWGFPLPFLLFFGINLAVAWTLASIAIVFIMKGPNQRI